ncbi:MAG: DNA internalization-related competence protein ComEC/Rec2 [Deltaproteobacteria bacterium]|jgi:competence protein ComEC|nr:DNA internalization-related competence protein ComEC/Rec2 [Deltaproteobacteria bacterium]MBT6432624.1 DNA internalization-related competence protein ComEC/Rec2 [Deltaproteobacteria bacterium]MBT6490695.1 DNA internalization-related competence protein ComEC/Rec2 [Deltaproteobacteria bacterium]
MHYPLLWLAFAPAVGVVLALGLEISVQGCLLALMGSLGVLWFALRRRRMVFLCAWVVLLNCGLSRVAFLRSESPNNPLSGVHTFKVLKKSEAARFISEEQTRWTLIDIGGQVFLWRVPKNVRARIGNRYRSKLHLEPMQPGLNGELLNILRARLRPATWVAISEGPAVLVEHASGLRSAIDDRRVGVAQTLAQSWQGNYLGVALALALGTRAALPEPLKRQWNDMGISHLLAISGLHLGLVGLFIFYALRVVGGLLLFGRGVSMLRRWAAGIALTGMWMFCFWVGEPVSAVRACLMGSVLFGGLVFRVSHNGFNALGLAGLVMVLCDPQCLLSIGAWLSFGCTWFLLLAANRPRAFETSWTTSWLTMTAVPWLATLPLCAFCFGELYIWGVPANLFAIALASWLVTPAALLGASFCFCGFGVPEILEWVLVIGFDSIQTLLGFLMKTGWTRVQISMTDACLLSVTVWPWLVAWLRGQPVAGIKAAAPGLLLAFLATLWSTLPLERTLQVYMPYVGHGDATLVEFPGGEVMLIDAGGTGYQSNYDPGERAVAPLLRKRGHTHIDYVVMTHPDHDHIGGLDYILSRFSVGELWLDEQFLGHERVLPLIAKVEQLEGEVRVFQDLPAMLKVGSAVLEPIYPRRLDEHLKYGSTNERSLVFRIEHEGRSMLFTGDVNVDVETLLLSKLKQTEFLKVAHHGSDTSSGERFLDVVQPCLAAVSSSHRGRGHFPHPEVVARYKASNTQLFQNRDRGALRISALASGWRVESVLAPSQDVDCTTR